MNTIQTTIDSLIKRAPALNDQIYNLVREIIMRSKAGQRLESERLLADRFKVSRPTVRRALDQLHNEGLIAKKPGKGNYITVKAGASTAAVLFYSKSNNLNSGIYQRYHTGILSVISYTRHNVMTLCNSDPDLSGPALELIPQGINVILTLGIMDSAYIRSLERIGVPVITADYYLPGLNADSVTYDTFGAGYILTDHLLGLGHTDVIFIGGYRGSETTHIVPETDSLKAQAGFEYRLRTVGLEAKPEQIKQLSIGAVSSARQLAQRIFSENNIPTGFIFFDPSHAKAFIETAQSLGLRIPDDVSMCCYGCDAADETTYRAITATLTDSIQLGRAAGQLLHQRLENPALPPRRVTLSVNIVERGTTAQPKRKF